jgi:DNA primase
VTEGQMDVVMSHQAGVTNTVATSGTSLTDEHLTTLYRYTPNIALAFDTDAAGERAAERAILMALAHGFTVRLILLTEKDPADLVKSNPDDWRKKTEASKEALSFIIDRAMGKFPHPSAEQKKSIAREVLPYLAALSDPIEQESWVKTLAGKLAVSEKTIYLALSKLPSKETIYVERPLARGQHKTILTPAETLVALILAYPEKADRVAKEFDAKLLESNAIAQIFQTVQKNWPSIKKEPKKISSILAKSLAPDLVKQVDYLVFTVTREFPDSGEVGGELAQLVEQVGGKKSEELKREFAAKIAAAESSGNREDVKKLIQEFQKLISK